HAPCLNKRAESVGVFKKHGRNQAHEAAQVVRGGLEFRRNATNFIYRLDYGTTKALRQRGAAELLFIRSILRIPPCRFW
ncbi:hypothetical protein, partial [Hominenteromicrobium sp.]|uniref:hypothetical protein n=1 Tax=Hominenteromicrobium sp. TaxID=3073581 RepID=UPI003AB66010